MKIINAKVTTCHLCRAEPLRPLPDGWTWTSRAYSKRQRTKTYQTGGFITAHKPGCKNGFQEITG